MDSELLNQLMKAAEVLKAFGAKEVFVFGSVANEMAGEFSDIDIAVSGLPPEVFFHAYSKAADCFRREMDLIDLDDDNPFTRLLKKRGELKRVG